MTTTLFPTVADPAVRRRAERVYARLTQLGTKEAAAFRGAMAAHSSPEADEAFVYLSEMILDADPAHLPAIEAVLNRAIAAA